MRYFRITGGADEVTERLECAFNETVFSYSVITPDTLRLEHCHAVVILSDAPGGACHVAWGSNWISTQIADAEMRVTLTQLYTTLIDAVAVR